MSTQLTFSGAEYITPDVTAGYGIPIANPSTLLSSMVTNQYYFREAGGDIDVIFLSAESFLISLFKSFTNQKLLQQVQDKHSACQTHGSRQALSS